MVKRKNTPKTKKSNGKRSSQRRSGPGAIALARPSVPSFGAVSTVNTAPVAIGNSLRGFQAQVLHTVNGAIVTGRDYGFTPAPTGTITGWAMVGGMPLTPACMPSTSLRNFCQMYSKFKFRRAYFHYITSSATSSTGDVIFQHMKDSASSPPEWSNNSFLPFVLSDPLTVIGPQWTNHTIQIMPKGTWKSTDYGMGPPSGQYSFGDIFLYSKTASTESPGYAIFDYEIEFSELSVNPRAGILPTIKAQWQQTSLSVAGAATANTTVMTGAPSTSGLGGTTITAASYTIGDVYKFTIDSTNSTYATASAITFFTYQVGANTGEVFTLRDGIVIFYVASASNVVYFYTDETEAFCAGNELRAGATVTYAETLRGFSKYIGSINPAQLGSSY